MPDTATTTLPQKGVSYERLEARISRDVKRSIQRAADLLGKSLTDFVVASSLEAATQVILQQEVLVLSRRDQDAFARALLKPAKPNAKLKAAAKRYREWSNS